MRIIEDILVCLRFWSRIPTPLLAREKDPHGMPDFARVTRVLPIAGAIIGLVGAVVFLAARFIGLPGSVAAGLALTALVLATGAFHEDGLADSADGLGGGMTRQRKLEIMKDSRIGTFGGAALVLSLGLRWSAIMAIDAAQGPIAAAMAIIAVASLSRMVALIPAVALEPARAEGAAQAAGAPSMSSFVIGMALAIALSGLLIIETSSFARWVCAVVAAILGACAMTWIAKRQIGGQTGDIAGASQQISEITFLLALASGQALQASF
ncbi:MAG: adenosylcobinamide-GDP ribazoletransferase [Beijerinckiaceae bacterium]|nr:adenosylcobinamide-GDP ribazoletransferase [Beijerinckiaceae bacterium]